MLLINGLEPELGQSIEKKCKVGIESTLIKTSKNYLTIIRPGKINIFDIKETLPFINIINNKNKTRHLNILYFL